jgi:hypothetical protein
MKHFTGARPRAFFELALLRYSDVADAGFVNSRTRVVRRSA